MKTVAVFLALFAVAHATLQDHAINGALLLRGGGAIGPLDSAMAAKLSKTAATAYVAGAASKYIVKQTGGSNTKLADFVTTGMFASNALIAAISFAMFGLGDTGFDSGKMLGALTLGALLLRLNDDGFTVDTVKDNLVETAIALVLVYVGFS